MRLRKYICLACKHKTGVDILYGMPTPEAFELAGKNLLALGGCCIDLDGPERSCTSCGHEWRIKRRYDSSLILPPFRALPDEEKPDAEA
jgi:hypothetical protein